jgi:hypothetical protein
MISPAVVGVGLIAMRRERGEDAKTYSFLSARQ